MTDSSVTDVVKAAYEAWSAAFNKADRKAIMALYAEGGKLFAEDMSLSTGELEKFFDGLFAESKLTNLTLKFVEARVNGDVIIASANWTAQGRDVNGQPLTIRRRGAHIFERQPDGTFK